MKIINLELRDFIAFLDGLVLTGFHSRMRTRFKNLLAEYDQRFENERMAIIKEHAKLDKSGNILNRVRDGVQVIDFKDNSEQKANAEFRDLCAEEVIIEENEERKKMLLSVRESILNYNGELSGRRADQYDYYADCFEVLYGESE